MSVVGSLIFCTDCGNLMDTQLNASKNLECDQCDASFPSANTTNLTVVTKSAPDAFPSALRSKRSVVKTSLSAGEVDEGAIIKEKCPECGHDEMTYHTLQLRSADEGATVFYTCTKCHYKFRTNN
ncbi:DNA-directed RNA polymerase I subunit RPA12 [Yarrowia sp. C11]|nr:DNA-directed RNA polymerase I subunit RPA12 [Yarrowia sp. E02]KAG5367364.1 DNA-directed RNA polymerase I subunit RPA12 [Yarrowia sp. C11]